MKKLLCLILIFCMLLSLIACKNKNTLSETDNSEHEMQEEISKPAADITESSDQEESSEPADEYEYAENGIPIHSDKIQSYCENSLEIANGKFAEDIGVRDWSVLVDNTTPIEELIEKHNHYASELGVWVVSQLTTNIFDLNYDEAVGTVEYMEELTGVEFSFVRTIGEFTNEKVYTPFTAMYTVLKPEFGGYLYVWFDYYPQTKETYLKNVVYVDRAMEISEFAQIKEGSTISDVEKITKSVSAQKTNPGWFPLNFSYILCKDGLISIHYDENLIVDRVDTHENFIIPAESTRTLNGDWNSKNYTILPQDYPPAE